MNYLWTTVHIIILHSLSIAFCGPTRDSEALSRSNAILHESGDLKGAKTSYRDEPGKWSNIGKLLDNVKFTPTMICVTGAWLVYGISSFRTSQDDEAKLVSGNDNCVSPEDIQGIMSMQPVTPKSFSSDSLSSIALFPHVNFGGSDVVISSTEFEQKSVKQLNGALESVGSAVAVGEGAWSLKNSAGKAICITPTKGGANSICYVRDLISVQLTDFSIVAVSQGCPDEDYVLADVSLTECKNFGSSSIESLKAPVMMGRSLGEDGEGQGSVKCKEHNAGEGEGSGDVVKSNLGDEERTLLEKMIRIRLTHDFEVPTQTLWPDREEDIWKTIPLDTAFDVVIATVPESIVSIPFLRRIREFTVYHLNEVWKAEGGGSNETASMKNTLYNWRNHKVIMYMLQKCLQIANVQSVHYQSLTSVQYNKVATIEEFTNMIHAEFVMNPEYDPVIETAWVVSNYAMALCHNAFQFNINFWDNFVTTFHSLYFKPLEERWKNPAILTPKSFRAVFAGFGTAAQYKRIAFAATHMLSITPNLRPFEKFY